MKIHLGCGKAKRPGCVGVDIADLDGVDIVHDLNVCPYPFEDNVAEEVVLEHILEHLPNTIGVMEEVWRLCKNGGRVEIEVPYFNSPGASQDPTHVRFFTEHSFDYFAPDGDTWLSHYNYYTKARFKVASVTPQQRTSLYWLPERVQWLLAHHLATVHGLKITLYAIKI
ncbi:MAG: methyltransferase domain-containing protein [Nitrososphaera sp.]|nr:methyltransferase domain-containing protein [Nitrososphaera sp.]